MAASHSSIERVQSIFLYKIFDLPHCVSYLTIFLEAGQYRLEHWLGSDFSNIGSESVLFSSAQDILFQALLSSNVFPKGPALLIMKIRTLGLSPDLLGSISTIKNGLGDPGANPA